MAKKANNKFQDIGLLLLRVGIGGMFMYHGWPKIAGGAAQWGVLGQSITAVGIPAGFVFWGFLQACAEFFGGIFLICGTFIRPFCILLCWDMIVAAAMQVRNGEGVIFCRDRVCR
jgi:Predicted membrane protein